jgi:hypothetical protein
MRRLLVLTCVAALLGLLVAVAPAIVRPDANRAEATVYCDAYQTVAQHGSGEAKVTKANVSKWTAQAVM